MGRSNAAPLSRWVLDRGENVREQVRLLKKRLVSCDLCPHRCRVNRLADEVGFCGSGAEIEVAHSGLHFGEEPPISGVRGSGAIFFTRCNMRCVYCQNYQISQRPHLIPKRALSPFELAEEMLALQAQDAHNINLVSPTHVVAQAAESICIARERGLSLPIVYNTNGYDAVDTLQCLDGLIDIYLPDIKYSDDAAARAYSGVERYVAVNRRAIREMFRQVGNLALDEHGIARRGLLVRHLVLPDDVAGSSDSLAFLASLSQDMVISLMAQYSPQFKARGMPPLDRKITLAEYDRVLDEALALGLGNCFVQECESSETLLPDFRRETPFDPPSDHAAG